MNVWNTEFCVNIRCYRDVSLLQANMIYPEFTETEDVLNLEDFCAKITRFMKSSGSFLFVFRFSMIRIEAFLVEICVE